MKNKILYGFLILLGLYAIKNAWRDWKGDIVKEVIRYKVEKIAGKTIYVPGKTVYIEVPAKDVGKDDGVKIIPDLAEGIKSGEVKVIGIDVPKSRAALGYTTNTSVYLPVKSSNNELILDEKGKARFIFDIKRKMIKRLMLKPALIFGVDSGDWKVDGGIEVKFVQVYRITAGVDVLTRSAGLGLAYQITPNVFIGPYLNSKYSLFLADKHINALASFNF